MTDIHGLKPDVWPNTPYNVTAQIRGDIRQIVQREIEQVTIEAIGAETPAGAQAKVDASALSLTAAIAAAKAELALVDDTKAALAHTHDDRYYLKSQVDAGLAGKAATVHTHHDKYYVKSEIDALLAGVSGGAGWVPVAATTTTQGIVELATTTEATTGTDTTRAVTPAGVAAAIAGVEGGVTDHGALNGLADDDHTQYALADGSRGAFAATAHTHTASQISDSTATGRTLITAATATAARTAISAAPALGSDDNYVTDAEKLALHSHSNKTALDAVSGTNTGDQTLPTWTTLAGKPAVVAAGDTQAAARTSIGAGTSSFSGAYADLTGKPDFAPVSGQFAVNTVAASGATETLPATHAAHKVTMDANCAFAFSAPTAGHAFVLHLSGAYTPTWPASVDWAGGEEPEYDSAGTLYHFVTVDAGTTWLGSGQAYS